MSKNAETYADLRDVTPEQLFRLGLQDLAYVKSITAHGDSGFAVCIAEGIEIATFPNRDVAFAACRQYDLEPVSLH
ncbi:MAG: DUF1150 family protein [Alphaproteobacteria bacterium]|jgi:hypothetical protein|nr:DUF1150 family protein [Alphaproteobacteria bacterium]